MVEHHIDEHFDPAFVRRGDEALEVVVRAVRPRDAVIVGCVVPVIAWRLDDRHQPDASRAEAALASRIAIVDVVELCRESVEVTNAVAVAVVERANEHLIAGCAVHPPRRVLCESGARIGEERNPDDSNGESHHEWQA